ncbi:hypothetical protein QOZ80_9AG0688510 [Eleusine coracana subsp. coracana]|nr:hypothetical protein QOZ80_9AG0688510 [Eleusine coracana subsp. coracana]
MEVGLVVDPSSRPRQPRSTAAAAGTGGGARRPITGIRRFPAPSVSGTNPSLPPLASLVLARLPARVDRIRFAAVCPEWRAAAREARLPPLPPLLALKDGTFYNVPNSKPSRFPCRAEGFATASDNWLLIPWHSYLLLLDPFTGATMTLPAPGSVHDIGGDSDSSEDYDDSDEDGNDPDESDNGFNEYDGSDEGDNDPDEGGNDLDDCDDFNKADNDPDNSENGLDDSDAAGTSFAIIKLIVCSPRLIAALFSSKGCCGIAVCRPGASLWSVAWNRSFRVTDMAFYKGRLYVVDDDDESLLEHLQQGHIYRPLF